MRYEALYEQIHAIHPQTIMEIGTHLGKRSEMMVRAAREHRNYVHYFGFDLFDKITEQQTKEEFHGKDKPSYVTARKRLYNSGGVFTLIEGNTLLTLPRFNPSLPIDFIFVDGGHSIETIQSDWTQCQRLMHEKTVVIFDDYYIGNQNENVGCANLVNSLDEVYEVEILLPIDKIEHRNLEIAVVKVCRAVPSYESTLKYIYEGLGIPKHLMKE